MKEIVQLTNELLLLVEKYRDGQVGGAEVEKKTSKIIVQDDYEKTEEQYQDCVELLDTWDIQNLSRDDLDQAIAYLKQWLESRSS